MLPQWKNIPDAAADYNRCDGKYWKPAAARRADGGRLWFVKAVLRELAAVAVVAVPFYVFLLWRW